MGLRGAADHLLNLNIELRIRLAVQMEYDVHFRKQIFTTSHTPCLTEILNWTSSWTGPLFSYYIKICAFVFKQHLVQITYSNKIPKIIYFKRKNQKNQKIGGYYRRRRTKSKGPFTDLELICRTYFWFFGEPSVRLVNFLD